MLSFKEGTPEKVKSVLLSVYNSQNLVRIVYGDVVTGRDWLEEHDVIGRVGRSTGEIKAPLLIKNERSNFGGSILAECILKIVDVKSKRVLYEATNYQKPILVLCASTHRDYMYDVCHSVDGVNKVHARFKSQKSAVNYIEFMHCKRMVK